MLRTLEWKDNALRLLDQTKLPLETTYIDCTDEKMAWDAIRRLVVRGAPAIGVAAGYGAYLGIAASDGSVVELHQRLSHVCEYLATARPTAVNLSWALQRVQRIAVGACTELAERVNPQDSASIKREILEECHRMLTEDVDCCRRIGEHALKLLPTPEPGQTLGILTHCNAGALATCGIGTALAPVYLGHQHGMKFKVYADETRPLLQGARLTALELSHAAIPVTLLCDNMAASLMSAGRIDAILVGADRIARNGDTANKIGTHGVAILARHFGIPMFVLAPTSTIDESTPSGAQIPIENRDAREVTHPLGTQAAPDGIEAFNPAFDVTPYGLIRAIVTENGVWRPRGEAFSSAVVT